MMNGIRDGSHCHQLVIANYQNMSYSMAQIMLSREGRTILHMRKDYCIRHIDANTVHNRNFVHS